MEAYKFSLNRKINELICRRIKLKSDLIEILAEVCSLIIINIPIHEKPYGECLINTGKTKRIFFSVQDDDSEIYKHFSIQFPFKLYEEDGTIKIKTLNGGVIIESHHIAALRTICSKGGFNEKEFRHGLLLDFSQLVESTLLDLQMNISYYENEINQILMELFTFEPSYIRYDFDEKNENGKYHPLHHFDISYTQRTTFKLGCGPIDINEFMDILDIEKECEFIGGPSWDLRASPM